MCSSEHNIKIIAPNEDDKKQIASWCNTTHTTEGPKRSIVNLDALAPHFPEKIGSTPLNNNI